MGITDGFPDEVPAGQNSEGSVTGNRHLSREKKVWMALWQVGVWPGEEPREGLSGWSQGKQSPDNSGTVIRNSSR